ncbi:rRNA (cytosine-C5-)-methyltransferase RCM1 [Mycosarcoma maydis]|uniref:SAM-dependent MTase RsmB/NOP-type domain-containing protein n=1 Tax=Mycosarcoma maydis TaxID=5270 RepID=A0A0D1DTQ7_MYCMD|nr:rRNA (cytosine-C5-)-methyltransferase RCM1 [Ustilago maydis 521]KIS65980.1 hypothetical protein UMAG_06069 [Ustilago maydis 521]|eukprot:XP_011392430.1 hypothetical protein UMAG_06069 [Ustilago maydis 521]
MADFYVRSAQALDQVLGDECSVKAAAGAHADSGRVLAIVINSLAYRSALMHAIDECRVAKLEERIFTLAATPARARASSVKDKNKPGKQQGKKAAGKYPSKQALLLVLCHDLLFQARGIQASKTWPPKLTLERYRPSLHSALVKLQIRLGKSRIQDLRSGALYEQMTARIPRWIRINPLRATRDQVLQWLSDNRYTQVDVRDDEIGGIKQFAESTHVAGLLAFHPKATSALLKSEMYRENWIVMQDLASCFPAYILDPPAGSSVIDATSAPGNKTSHLSAIMHSKSGSTRENGRIDAFERDAARYKTLVKRLDAVGALALPRPQPTQHGNVTAHRRDFLTTNPDDFPNVTHMLLDPSCSGSGIVNRLDFLKEDDDVEHDPLDADALDSDTTTKLARRLRQLSEFQQLMIRHAFKFPALRKVVYSTCSVHAQENELVVINALQTHEAQSRGWKLAPRKHVIPTWPVRGDTDACTGKHHVAESVIRCIPGGKGEGDKPNVESCNGFFVACFIRDDQIQHDEQETAANKRPFQEQDDVDDDGQAEDEAQEPQQQQQQQQQQPQSKNANAAANRKKKLQKRRKKQRLEFQQQQL